ncbi:MAG: ABC transporter permease [Bacteroidetes bacterium]|nr:ABC transporter permease [Bacteroidota bacterium]
MEQIVTIKQSNTEKNYWKDLWNYRELFYILSWRDIKVRYKQTVLGILWAVIRPLLTMIVFTIVFGRVAKMETLSIVPYSLIVFAGLLPWQFFSAALSESSNSLTENVSLITKVYFPRLIIPVSSIITCFIDFLISFIILLILFLVYQYTPPVQILVLPFFVLLLFITTIGSGLFLTTLNVKYRDFRYIVPFVIQFGLFISPVGFSSSMVPDQCQWAYSLNPMVGVIDGFRWCIIQGAPNPLLQYPFYISLSIAILLAFSSISLFRRMEKSFADLI